VEKLHKVVHELRWWGRGLVRHLPDKPYPSNHPTSRRGRSFG